ncbi:PREDICTED: senescence/dehydration-associated protein At4g35985, chloroplastic-like [Camelina sativa]|uniref:Senescence/dehydration-associated protein At4g35985, chloroplastic-like n=1 Tax=Camelina sativa TaxID=90675 RepID=A0ABM0XMM0_CAMSA|nr:PREDICTED: senescence/dehydration-associated protein At4g35985, chloroplastic-like [Camelina sativa]
MGCFGSSKTSKTRNHKQETMTRQNSSPQPQPQSLRTEEVLLQIPRCRVHLINESEALELASGDFKLVKVSDNGLTLAMIVRIGHDLQWPVIRDEPVVKLDARDYLFTLPVKDGDPLSYGVTFSGDVRDVALVNSLKLLDQFLSENSCFSHSASSKVNKGIDWEEFAPRIEDYNNVLAKAIAGGTGHIIRGIFSLSNAYSNQVHKGGDIMITKAEESQRNGGGYNNGHSSGTEKKNGINTNLQRVRKMSKATESLSKTMLNGAGVVSGSVMVPVMKSKPGMTFFSMVPGEVLLASLDALNKILDATEAAERQTLSATSRAATRMVSERFGDNAGEATGDVLATAGHAAGTAWNVLKIRKTFYPSSSLTSGIVRNAPRK